MRRINERWELLGKYLYITYNIIETMFTTKKIYLRYSYIAHIPYIYINIMIEVLILYILFTLYFFIFSLHYIVCMLPVLSMQLYIVVYQITYYCSTFVKMLRNLHRSSLNDVQYMHKYVKKHVWNTLFFFLILFTLIHC